MSTYPIAVTQVVHTIIILIESRIYFLYLCAFCLRHVHKVGKRQGKSWEKDTCTCTYMYVYINKYMYMSYVMYRKFRVKSEKKTVRNNKHNRHTERMQHAYRLETVRAALQKTTQVRTELQKKLVGSRARIFFLVQRVKHAFRNHRLVVFFFFFFFKVWC